MLPPAEGSLSSYLVAASVGFTAADDIGQHRGRTAAVQSLLIFEITELRTPPTPPDSRRRLYSSSAAVVLQSLTGRRSKPRADRGPSGNEGLPLNSGVFTGGCTLYDTEAIRPSLGLADFFPIKKIGYCSNFFPTGYRLVIFISLVERNFLSDRQRTFPHPTPPLTTHQRESLGT